MSGFNLSKREFESCVYDAGYMSYLLSILMHKYEIFKYDVIPMSRIGVQSYLLYPNTKQNNKRRSVEVKELTLRDLKIYREVPQEYIKYKYTFLPPTQLKDRSFGVTHGIDEDILKKYPYIQEFIDFVYGCRIRLKDDSLFVGGLKKLLEVFLDYNKDEINHYRVEHCSEVDETCSIDRSMFFNAFSQVVKKYEGATSCENSLTLIKMDEDGKRVVDLLQEYTFFSPRCNFQLTLHAGKFDDEELKADDYFNKSVVYVEDMIALISSNCSAVLEELKYFKMFFNGLFLVSRDKNSLQLDDIQRVFAELANYHSSNVHTRRF